MSLSWYRTGKAAVTQNSNIVRFTAANITTAPNKPVVGDAFLINNGTKLYEIIAIGSDTTGEYIRLDKIYAESTAVNSDYAIIRFASGTQNAKLVAMASAAINQKQISLDDMYEWYTTTADTVDFLGVDGVPVTVKSYFKLASETGDVANNSGAVTTVSTNIEAVKAVSADMPAIKDIYDNGGVQILMRDPRRKAVEDASGGRNTVIYDAQGNSNVMVVVPRFTYESLGLTDLQLGTGTPTAFLTNGAPRGEILIAKYLASAGGTTCSVVGGVQPLTGVNYDQAKSRCTGKGANWHLMSMHEWAAIALWSLANGTVPRGNTNYGRAHDKLFETARRADNGVPGDASGTGRTDTGKGPTTWTHDNTVHGIHDLVGNIWEWQDQMMLSEGQIKTTIDNNPSVAEVDWVSHPAFYDSTSAAGGAPRLNSQVINRLGAIGDSANAGNSATVDFKLLTKDAAYTPSELMRRLLIETATANNLQGRLYMRNFGQRLPIRGGSWGSGVSAGLGALNLVYSRSYSGDGIGFRPAYFA